MVLGLHNDNAGPIKKQQIYSFWIWFNSPGYVYVYQQL